MFTKDFKYVSRMIISIQNNVILQIIEITDRRFINVFTSKFSNSYLNKINKVSKRTRHFSYYLNLTSSISRKGRRFFNIRATFFPTS